MERSKLKSVSLLRHLTSLEELDFYGCKNLKDIEPLSYLFNLRELCIKETNVTNLNCLENLIYLENLMVSDNFQFIADVIS